MKSPTYDPKPFDKIIDVAFALDAEDPYAMQIDDEPRVLGGAGSGNFGHSGRPGEIGGSGDSTGAGGYVDFERQALANLDRTSRTATGVSDTSSSDDKPKLTVEGAGLAQKSKENFTGALRMAWSAKDQSFESPAEVLNFTEQIAGKVSDGLLQPGQGLYRTWATENDQLDPAKIPGAMKDLTTKLHARLQDPAKAVETAAWLEKSLAHIQPWADGVGRTTKALSAMVLARGGVKLPVYPESKTYYQQIQSPDWPRHFAEMIPR